MNVLEDYEQLELEFGQWEGCGWSNTVACASGTAALHLALEALQLPLGSKVLVPDYTMIACARAVTMAGLEPVFVDCGEDLLIDPDQLEKHYNLGVRAIMPVHIYGRRCNMERIMLFAKTYSLAVIEDLAEAHGILPHPESDAACWSFYSNKIIAGEEGGMIAFHPDKHLRAVLAKQLRCLGFTNDHNFLHIPRGINARMSNAHARLALGSLRQFEENHSKRAAVSHWYDALLPSEFRSTPRHTNWFYDIRLPGAVVSHWYDSLILSELRSTPRHANWFYDIRLPGMDVPKVLNNMKMMSVPVCCNARLGFRPMTEQPEYKPKTTVEVYTHKSGVTRYELEKDQADNPVARRLGTEVLLLPIRPDMSYHDVGAVVASLLGAIEHYSIGEGRQPATGGG